MRLLEKFRSRAPMLSMTVVCAAVGAACAASRPAPPPAAPLTPPTTLCTQPASAGCRDAVSVERWLRRAPLEILGVAPAPGGVSGVKVLTLRVRPRGEPAVVLRAKWREHANVMFNDSRKELCAYAVQKLFLEPHQFVVPPTTTRCFAMARYHRLFDAKAKPTFPETRCVYGVLSYWLEDIERGDGFDEERFEEDLEYREAVANFNLFTYLILHGDSHDENFFVPEDPRKPRIYSVDNAVAFSSLVRHPRDFFLPDWSELRVPAVSEEAVERLRRLDSNDLRRLSVVEQSRLVDGVLVPVEPTLGREDSQGARFVGRDLQIGLTASEVDDLHGRIRALLDLVATGELRTF